MKLKGEFIVREIFDEHILIPVGETALVYNGIIRLDPVGNAIWEKLKEAWDENDILKMILAEFDVSIETARKDMEEFFCQLRKHGLAE